MINSRFQDKRTILRPFKYVYRIVTTTRMTTMKKKRNADVGNVAGMIRFDLFCSKSTSNKRDSYGLCTHFYVNVFMPYKYVGVVSILL